MKEAVYLFLLVLLCIPALLLLSILVIFEAFGHACGRLGHKLVDRMEPLIRE